MDNSLLGLHHVTAVTANASRNLNFYTETLGMRLVKKTVNQDDVSAYHLFYADSTGSPGSDLTFFDWPQSAPCRPGAGTVAETSLRVTGPDSVVWWEKRFEQLGVAHDAISERIGKTSLAFTDFEGQRLRLVNDGGAGGGTPWAHSEIPETFGIRGLGSVTLEVARLAPTLRVLTDVMGFRSAGEYQTESGHDAALLETGSGGLGAQVVLVESPGTHGSVGKGGVHHVAFRTPDVSSQELWRKRLQEHGLGVTPLIDRFYFHSIYFREPGGILFEIATDGPGFAADEDAAHLGEHLALPPFLETHRAQIEAGLKPL